MPNQLYQQDTSKVFSFDARKAAAIKQDSLYHPKTPTETNYAVQGTVIPLQRVMR